MSDQGQFASLSQPQRDALCNVAFGGKGASVNPRTLESLANRGLIEPYGVRDGMYSWREWTMPLPVHIAFCQWCEEEM